MNIKPLPLAALVTIGATFGLRDRAYAFEPSTRGPLYVQGSPLGVGIMSACAYVGPFGGCASSGAYYLNFEVGMHFLGHHEGPVAGIRQGFYLSSGSAGVTQARLGWDIAIPIRNFEITIAPYGAFGIFYSFNGGDPAFAFGIGAEGKFFFWKGLYAFFRPFEGGAAISSSAAFLANFAVAGIGYAPDL